MNSGTRRQINNIAETIRDVLKVKTPVNNIEEIITRINGTIKRIDILPDDAEGKIYRDGESFVIEIPRMDNPLREKFTIAHELGHLFLHMGYLTDKDIWNENENKVYLRKEIGEMEYQAHEFAAAFLMPRSEFYNIMNENYNGDGTYSMDNVADYFGVSVEAAVNRGRWLEILAWG